MTQETAAAGRYAQAWVALAHRQKTLDAALRDLTAVQTLLEQQPPLRRLLDNPEVDDAQKQALLTRLLERRVEPLVLRLLGLLLWKRRLPLLPAIVLEARRLRDQVEGVSRGVVRTARPLPASALEQITKRLERRLGRRLTLTASVEPALLGGVVIQLGHTVLDGSLRQGLRALRERLGALNVA